MNYLKLTLAMLACPFIIAALAQTKSCRNMKARTPPPQTKNERTEKALVGVWGGKSALLNVHEEGAGLDLACAHGSIEQPILLDSNSTFDLPGTYEQESFGPQVEGENKSQPARYIGKIQERTMTLTIKLTRSGETIGPMTLNFGKMTMLQKCQ
jgi:hypothetical protein